MLQHTSIYGHYIRLLMFVGVGTLTNVPIAFPFLVQKFLVIATARWKNHYSENIFIEIRIILGSGSTISALARVCRPLAPKKGGKFLVFYFKTAFSVVLSTHLTLPSVGGLLCVENFGTSKPFLLT